ncbi:MAG TPA: DUF1634 domain-containing protein [Terriglobales bacterium]|nr:DUF1634 domain-containing protein [Terriglobales bacterium]
MGKLLIAGVLLAAFIVLCGGARYLYMHGAAIPHYRMFRGSPSDLRSLDGILKDATARQGEGLIQLGILLLVATPITRVAFSIFAFVRQRDYLYVGLTLIVFTLLMYSFIGGLYNF